MDWASYWPTNHHSIISLNELFSQFESTNFQNMTHLSSDYLLKFVWGIFTGEILIFHNLYLNLQTDQQYKDKNINKWQRENNESQENAGHYLVKDNSTCMDLWANFEDKPSYKTGLLNSITEPSNSLRPGILGYVWLLNIQCYVFLTFNLGIINLGTIKNRTP